MTQGKNTPTADDAVEHGVIDMSANENPFGPSPMAVRAMADKLPALAAYPDRDDAHVCNALVACHDVRLSAQYFTTTNSGVDMLSLIERALFIGRSSVIICTPAFYQYQRTSEQNQASVIEVALNPDDFSVNVDAVLGAVREDTRLVFLCNPDNPTGRLFDDAVLAQLLDRLPPHVTLVYDEVYYHFVGPDLRPNVVEHVLEGKNLVVLHSFSKVYGLAGMRLGYVMAHPGIVDKIKAVKLPYQVGALGLVAMQAALQDTAHVQKTVDNNTEQRAFMLDALLTIGYKVWPTQGNFILVQCPDNVSPSVLVTRLQDAGIKVRAAFGLDNHIRVTISLQEHNARFIKAMTGIMAGTVANRCKRSVESMTTQSLTGGEAAVETLLRHNVDTLFCLPGVQNDWLFNALYDRGQSMRVIHTRHEQGAAYMALGYALAKDKLGVFSVVPGPGILNASAALATAYALNAKVLCLAGQLPSTKIDQDLGQLHEINNQIGLLRSLTKWAERANHPAQIPPLIDTAIDQIMTGRPRPAAVELPMDVLAQTAPIQLAPSSTSTAPPILDEAQLERAVQLLSDAERPMIFVGSGAMGVSDSVRMLAERLQAPVVDYRTGKGIVDARHYLSLQQPAAKRYWSQADVVLAIGCQMRVPLQKWANAHRPALIRVDIDPMTHNKFATPTLAITALAEHAVPRLLEAITAKNHQATSREGELTQLRDWWQDQLAVLEPQMTYLKIIREALGEHGIFVDELTQVGFASRIAWPTYAPRTYITTGYQGTLGYGFPTALGVKVARPDVPVVSITGDGGFMFAVQELATAVQHKIPLITIVFNNNQYGNVQQMQKNDYGGRVIASDLVNPDFVTLAKTFGARAYRAKTTDALAQILSETIAQADSCDLPTVVEVPVGDMPSIDQFR